MAEAKYCTFCNGTGKVTCKRCGGKGTVPGNVNWNKHYTCIKCGGKGEEDCPFCGGMGFTNYND